MQIKDMPDIERPEEKLLYLGAESLSNAELFSLIIRTGGKDNSALRIGEEVVAYISNELNKNQIADVNELIKISGIGRSKACSIVSAMELAKRFSLMSGRKDKKSIIDSKDVANYMLSDMKYRNQEYVVELILNVKMVVESKVVISIGNIDSAPIHPREVFSPAIRKGAAGIILVHNHPSGDPTPSEDDKISTKRLIEASKLIGISFLDHIIIGEEEYISMRDEGFFKS